MTKRATTAAVGSLLVLGSMMPGAIHADEAEPSTIRLVEIPGAGAVVALPRTWQTWLRTEYEEVSRQAPGVWTSDPETGLMCHLRTGDEPVSAQEAADTFIEALELVPYELLDYGSAESTFGSVISVTIDQRDSEVTSTYHDVYVDVPGGVVLLFCGQAPLDAWIEVAQAIVEIPDGYTPEPLDPPLEP